MIRYILADDFSGAHDVGLPFALNGMNTVVVSDLTLLDRVEADVIVLDTDSRDAPSDIALERVRLVCKAIREVKGALLYKKIDSTARGPIGQELDVIQEIFGPATILLTPAFPDMGRATIGGYVLLHGIPVNRTAMGQDPGAPVMDAYLPEALRKQSAQTIAHIDLRVVQDGPAVLREHLEDMVASGIVVMDAAANEDLQTILEAADAMRSARILCGSAGMAYPLARRLASGETRQTPVFKATSGPILTLAGSAHPVTARQIDVAGRDTFVRRLDALALLSDHTRTRDREIDGATRDIMATLRENRDAVLALAPSSDADRTLWLEQVSAAAGDRSVVEELTDILGRIGEQIARNTPLGGLVLTGGETAERVTRRLGARGTRLVDAIGTGIARACLLGGTHDGLPVVVKPGAFGGEDGLTAAIAGLRSAPAVEVSERTLPVLGITIGDPNGVGPEIIAKTLSHPELYHRCRPLVIGHADVMRRNIHFADAPLEIHPVAHPSEGYYQCGIIDTLDAAQVNADELIPGTVQEAAGRLAVESVIRATRLALDGAIQAVVTAPLNKEAMNLAGYHYAGHTELLADLTGTRQYRLTLAFDRMLVSHVTTHVSLRQAIDRISEEGVLTTVEIIGDALKRMGIAHPRIALCGLNPHAGEGGMFGDEEIRIIAPAAEKARRSGWNILGPLPPDTVFMRARRGEFDGIVGMYHDQGHIPVKAIAFDRTVNVSLGLPIIRTSVDHGTAFDIAGKGIANAENLDAAITLAIQLVGDRWSVRE
jgi:4-hydroxythreonine-4-phosphate dehydrogenase